MTEQVTYTHPRPSLTVDAVVLAGSGSEMSLLTITRGAPPYAGAFAFPGGFVEQGEPLLSACLRELKEETGLDLTRSIATPLSLRARAGRDPRGWTLSQPFLFHLTEDQPLKAGDDAREAQWLPLAKLERLAFDHGAILCEALGKFWQDMPTAAPQLMGIQGFEAPLLPPNPIFFGGTFNPVHDGHLISVKNVNRPKVLVVVPDTNPFKDLAPLAEGDCAWSSYRDLCRTFGEDVLAVFPGFWGQERPNPTVSWLPFVAAESLGLLVGEDSLVDLPKWLDAENLITYIDALYVSPRLAEKADTDRAKAWIQTHNPDCRITRLPKHPYQNLSSTQLRAQC